MDKDEYEKLLKQLQEAVDNNVTELAASVKASLESLDSTLSLALASAESVCGTINEALDNFEGTLTKAESAVGNVSAGVVNHCEQTMSLLSDAQDEQDDAAEEVDEAIDEFDEYVEEVVETVDGLKEAVADLFRALIDTSIQLVAEKMIQPMEAFRDDAIEQVQVLLDENVHDPVNEQLEEIVKEALAELRAAIDKAIDQLKDGLVEFRSSVVENAEAASHEREASGQIRELLDEALSPVINALDRVSSLADSVGISIG